MADTKEVCVCVCRLRRRGDKTDDHENGFCTVILRPGQSTFWSVSGRNIHGTVLTIYGTRTHRFGGTITLLYRGAAKKHFIFSS